MLSWYKRDIEPSLEDEFQRATVVTKFVINDRLTAAAMTSMRTDGQAVLSCFPTQNAF
jgi:hypothetical protein